MTSLWCFTLLSGLLAVQGEYWKLEWKPILQFNIKSQREFAGVNYVGKPIFVVRVVVEDGYVIGKFHPYQYTVHYNLPGTTIETIKKPSEVGAHVLVYGRGTVDWTEKWAGQIQPPPNLILAGFYPRTKEPIYICRHERYGHIEPGTFRFSEQHKGCQSVEGNYFKLFELISLSFYGIATGHGAD